MLSSRICSVNVFCGHLKTTHVFLCGVIWMMWHEEIIRLASNIQLSLQWLVGERCQACTPLGNTVHGGPLLSPGWKPSTAFITSPSSPWCCSDSSPPGCFSSGPTPSSPQPIGPWINAASMTPLWSTFLSLVLFLRGGTSAVACTPVLMCTDVATIQKTESR